MVSHLAQRADGVFAPKHRGGKKTFPHAPIAPSPTASGGLGWRLSQGDAMLLGQTLRMRKQRLRTGRIDQGHLKQHID
jgi:hypothetical protein